MLAMCSRKTVVFGIWDAILRFQSVCAHVCVCHSSGNLDMKKLSRCRSCLMTLSLLFLWPITDRSTTQDYVREARKRELSESAARKRCHAAAGELHFSIQQRGAKSWKYVFTSVTVCKSFLSPCASLEVVSRKHDGGNKHWETQTECVPVLSSTSLVYQRQLTALFNTTFFIGFFPSADKQVP